MIIQEIAQRINQVIKTGGEVYCNKKGKVVSCKRKGLAYTVYLESQIISPFLVEEDTESSYFVRQEMDLDQVKLAFAPTDMEGYEAIGLLNGEDIEDVLIGRGIVDHYKPLISVYKGIRKMSESLEGDHKKLGVVLDIVLMASMDDKIDELFTILKPFVSKSAQQKDVLWKLKPGAEA